MLALSSISERKEKRALLADMCCKTKQLYLSSHTWSKIITIKIHLLGPPLYVFQLGTGQR